MRAAAVSLLLLTSCQASDELLRGVAVWPFVLTTDTHYGELAHVRGGVVVLGVVEVGDLAEWSRAPVRGAVASARVGGHLVHLPERQAGLYVTEGADVPDLYAPAGSPTRIRVRVSDRLYSGGAPVGLPLTVEAPLAPHRAGRSLTLDLPEGYEAEYDQILAEVRDLEGEVTWSNWPDDLEGWLRFASSSWTPAGLEVPGEAFPESATLYAISVFGVIRAREDATWSSTLNARLSGYTTGSALAVPVWTAP